jgi:hypothetical protein
MGDQIANGKWQMANPSQSGVPVFICDLLFAICHLPFAIFLPLTKAKA